MIKLENTEVIGWEAAIRGMRNPMNSWEKSDSNYRPILASRCDTCTSYLLDNWDDCDNCEVHKLCNSPNYFLVGPNDLDLMTRLSDAGTDHRKFMRMITVYVDILAPLYWWKEFDTYKVGTVANSCSTMHTLTEKPFSKDDFSHEHLCKVKDELMTEFNEFVCLENKVHNSPYRALDDVVEELNQWRDFYLCYKKRSDADPEKIKKIWWQMIQLLPSSYNQRRTVMLNYEVLANMYKSRKNHKLDEWCTFCDWIERLPYSELITGEFDEPGVDKNESI